MSPHLVVDVSSHGFGHVAQTAPVVNALREHLPHLRVTLRANLPLSILQPRFNGAIDLIPQANDIGMYMASALDGLVDESAHAYREFHASWQQRVAQDASALSALRPELVLANVPYLTIAAAAHAGIPAVAMSSLNWAAIYAHYCGHRPEGSAIHNQILQAYTSAEKFLRVTPGLPMEDLPNVLAVGPVAALGENRRDSINEAFGLSVEERLVLFGLGGVATRLPIESWTPIDGVRWLVPPEWQTERSDTITFSQLTMPFLDILASCDAVLTKPGYGAFVEAACNGVRVLTVERPDWPEEVYLKQWLSEHATAAQISRDKLWGGDLDNALDTLFSQPSKPKVFPEGVIEVAEFLASRMGT